MRVSLRHAALAAAVATLLSPAAAAGASSLTLNPVCLTKTGAALFFLERVDDCGGAQQRRCRGHHWAWATLKSGAWEFEALGEAALDDDAAPESNASTARQAFKAPASQTCVSFFRVPRVREPDLSDSEAFFQYSIERGSLVLRWQEQKALVTGEVRLSKLSLCGKKCEARDAPKVESRAVDAGLTIVDGKAGKQAAALMVPVVELSLGSDLLLGFAEPAADSSDLGFLVVLVPEAKLRALQAQLLHEDAKKLVEKSAGDLLASARAAGLLDAALQLAPGNGDARLDYARLLARQGEASAAIRELEHLKSLKDLRAKIDSDKAFDPVRAKEQFKKLLEALK